MRQANATQARPLSGLVEDLNHALWRYCRNAGGTLSNTEGYRPTNLSFLDPLIGGGMKPGHVYALLGMMGVCKTTFAVQLASSMAIRCFADWLASEKRASLGRVYLFTLEAGRVEIQFRSMAFSAQVPRSAIKPEEVGLQDLGVSALFDESVLSSLVPPDGGTRMETVRPALNNCLKWTGASDYSPRKHETFIEFVLQVIQDDLEHTGSRDGDAHAEAVIIDEVGLAAELTLQNQKQVNLSRVNNAFPKRIRDAVGRAFSTPVWLTKQLSGVANEQEPWDAPSADQAKGCKTFAEHVDTLFTVGADDDEALIVLKCVKDKEGAAGKERILKLDGPLSTLRDFDHLQSSRHPCDLIKR